MTDEQVEIKDTTAKIEGIKAKIQNLSVQNMKISIHLYTDNVSDSDLKKIESYVKNLPEYFKRLDKYYYSLPYERKELISDSEWENIRSQFKKQLEFLKQCLEQKANSLKQKAHEFFKKLKFELNTDEEITFLTYHGNNKAWQKKLPPRIPLKIISVLPLDSEKIQNIYQAACQKLDSPPTMLFIVVNRPPDISAWLQILTYRTKQIKIILISHIDIFEGQEHGSQWDILNQHLYRFTNPDYDLYNVHIPLADSLNFFGREEITERLSHDLLTGNPVALFGIRKIGKSSLLKYLRQALPCPTAFVDLQSSLALPELYQDILDSWQYSMSDKLPQFTWPLAEWQTTENASTAFIMATKQLLNYLAEQEEPRRLCLLLDEIEIIFPQDKADDPDYLAFSRVLRALVQQHQNFSVLIAGRNPACVRTNLLTNVENPFYQFFREVYLPGLSPAHCAEMILNIGYQMDLRYEDGAVDLIVELSGGQPFLARQLCSLAFEKRQTGERLITVSHLEKIADLFLHHPAKAAILDEAGLWGEICHPKLWSKAQIMENEAILKILAKSQPRSKQSLLKQSTNRRAFEVGLYELKQRDILGTSLEEGQPEKIQIKPLLFRNWIRYAELGTKA